MMSRYYFLVSKKFLITLFTLFSFLAILAGCVTNLPTVSTDISINPAERDNIQKVNNILINCIKKKDFELFEKNLSSNSVANGYINKNILNRLSSISFNENSTCYTFADFHIEHDNQKSLTLLRGRLEDRIDYTFSFNPISDETYVHIFSIDGVHTGNKYIISTVYNREDSEWKLSQLGVGLYTYKNKNAFDYLNQAMLSYSKKDLVSSVMNIQIASGLIGYSNASIKFGKEDSIKNAYNSIMNEFGKEFPIVLDSTQKKTTIISISIQNHNGMLYPLVFYKSNINLTNTVNLEEESKYVSKKIFQLFPNLKRFADTTIFSAVNNYVPGKKIENYREFYY